MKRILRYYFFLERPILIITTALAVTILIGILLLIFALITNSLYEIGNSVYDYFSLRGDQRQFCEALAKHNSDYYWKDETILGFGPNGSFGCFLSDPKPNKHEGDND